VLFRYVQVESKQQHNNDLVLL